MRRSWREDVIRALLSVAVALFILYEGRKLALRHFHPAPDAGYAERMADHLYDTPACAQYRQAILAHANESSASGKTVMDISDAYEAGKRAGCRKPD